MFPTDPNAPGGPDRSEYLQRDHAGRGRFRRALRQLTLAEPRPASASAWPPVRQLARPSSEPGCGSGRFAA
jgi:hypothetical protein